MAGEKQATRALQIVDSAMQRTEKQSQQLNTGLNANVKKSGDAFKTLGNSASMRRFCVAGLGGPVASRQIRIGGRWQIQAMAELWVGGRCRNHCGGWCAALASAFATLVD